MINLNLTVQEINVILQVLAQGPYAAVADIMQKIKTQAEEQVNQDK